MGKSMILVLLVTLLPATVPAAGELAGVPIQVFPPLERATLAQEDLWRADQGLPYRFALSREVALTPANSGRWESLAGEQNLWRLRVRCPGALSLNLGFLEYHLPSSARLLIYAADGSGSVFHFGAGDNRPTGQLWTPILLTSELVVELTVASADRNLVDLELGRVGCGYRFFGEDPAAKSGSCNIDVVCPEADGWRDDIPSVGMYTINGSNKCTGALVNNTAQDQRPLFLTANHCEVSAANAASVVVYWNFESPVCGAQAGGSLEQFTAGDTLLAHSATSDFALLELAESPDPVFGVAYAGWDRSAAVPDTAVTIHHPNTDEKSISFEFDPLQVTTYLQTASPGNGTHLRIVDWDLGTTEPGSSGSPLFDMRHHIVGQLHGGYAACNNDLSDWYGRFHVSWLGDGTPETRLQDYLDPGETGAQTLNRYGSDNPEPPPEGELDLTLVSVAPNPSFTWVSLTYHLNQAASVRVRVLDMAGHQIRDLGLDAGGRGENELAWDGKDDRGRPVSAGLYLVYLEGGGRTARGQLIHLK